MNWNQHPDLTGTHAFLGPSRYYWINYDEDKLRESFSSYMAAERGTRLHAFAAECINLGQRLPKANKTLNMYVNDAIMYHMVPEQVLYYSKNCYGTADTICYRNNSLRIHDLKTGTSPTHMEQLMIYAALFCLEYKINPERLKMELRIYQNDEVLYHCPEGSEIREIADKIVRFDRIIDSMKG